MQKNYHQALRYFSLASQSGLYSNYFVLCNYDMHCSGSTLAIHYLGTMHAYGIGVPKSCHTAVEVLLLQYYNVDDMSCSS